MPTPDPQAASAATATAVVNSVVPELLAPISDENPAGEWLRYDPLYDQIAEARRQDDLDLPRGVWTSDLKRADWDRVEELCSAALTDRTKDLQIAAWWLEASMHRRGFPGLAEGLELIAGVLERYWDDGYPALDGEDGEDVDARMAPLRWINEKLSVEVKLLPISQPTPDDLEVFSWYDHEMALREANEAARHDASEPKAAARRAVERVEVSVSATPAPKLAHQVGGISAALAELDRIDEIVDSRCGSRGASLGRLRDVLDRILHFVDPFAAAALATAAAAVAEAAAEEAAAEELRSERPGDQDTPVDIAATDPPSAGDIVMTDGPIRSRAEAYRMLEAAADYLMKTEPHSPTPYLVRRAASWGNLSLDRLLQELFIENDIHTVYKFLGFER